jgi:glycolate oxidase FAD binding subunit
MRVLKPDTEDEVIEAVRDTQSPLIVEGRGTKLGIGRSAAADSVLRVAGLTGITMYEPDEMVFTARAGTPLAEIEEALAAKGQCLGFEPGDMPKLWSDHADNATLGGTIAAAVAGPRRFAAGGARDHLLGFTAVNGKGERFKAGGRVVKNVTGYDLPKLAAGSFGTLFVMTELTLRALPRGTATTVLAVPANDAAEALKLLRAVARSPFEPSGLVFLPKDAASRAGIGDQAQALIRLEGQSEGVAARAAELTRTLAPQARTLEAEEGTKLFRAIADIHPLFDRDGVLWRVSVPPTAANDLVTRLAPASWIADAAGGTLWLSFTKPTSIAAIHAAAREGGGHATLIRKGLTQTDNVFPPLEAAALALTARVKLAFDPARNLNPGRMYKDV